MQRFDDLSDEEVLALTPEQIERWVDIECAIAGAPLEPEHPGTKPEESTAAPDRKTYVVEGMHFDTMEDAEAVANAINSVPCFTLNYAEGGGYRNQVVDRAEPVSVSTAVNWSVDGWNKSRGEVASANKAISEWDRAKQAYDKAMKARRAEVAWIYERIERLGELEQDRQSALRDFNRYLDLANGDDATARRFFQAARPDDMKHLPDAAPEAATEEHADATQEVAS